MSKQPKLAVVNAEPRPDWRDYDDVLPKLRALVAWYREVGRFLGGEREKVPDEFPAETLADCRAFLAQFDTDRWYVEPLWRRIVGEEIAILVGCYPNLAPGSPEIFTRALVEDVIAEKCGILHLHSACRRIRRSKRFLSIAEVLAVIRDEGNFWGEVWGAIENFEHCQGFCAHV